MHLIANKNININLRFFIVYKVFHIIQEIWLLDFDKLWLNWAKLKLG